MTDASDSRVEVWPYDASWPQRFAAEARAIAAALGETAVRIEHVGSTAVPGLAAKPIVDIQLSVPSLEANRSYREPLEALGYVHHPDDDQAHELFFKPAEGWPHDFQVHVCSGGGDWERRHIEVRDYLRAHPTEADAYEGLKKELATRHAADRAAYQDGKSSFLDTLERRAGEWARNSQSGN